MPAHPKPAPFLAKSLALILVLGGCTPSRTTSHDERAGGDASSDGASAQTIPEGLLPWTDGFQKSAVLLANEVRVEGPTGLIAHIATVSNPEELDRTEKATPDGFLQVIESKPGVHGVEIKAQLDRLTIVALQRISVLERPGAKSVLVDARGDVFWQDLESKAEKRVESLRLEGKIPR